MSYTKQIASQIKHWIISCQVIKFSLQGDPLETNRLLITGHHSTGRFDHANPMKFKPTSNTTSCELIQHIRSDYNIREFCIASIASPHLINHPVSITDSFPVVFQNLHLLSKEVHLNLHASHPGRELPQYLRFTKCETPFFVYFIS